MTSRIDNGTKTAPKNQTPKINQSNTAEYKDFTELQLKATKEALTRICKFAEALNVDCYATPTQLLVKKNILVKPYSGDSATLEHLPENLRNNKVYSSLKILVYSSEDMPEIIAKVASQPGLRDSFPEINAIIKCRESLNEKEKILYSVILFGVGHAFFPPNNNQSVVEAFKDMKLAKRISDISKIEKIESLDKKKLFLSRVVMKQVIEAAKKYTPESLTFPEVFTNEKLRDWTVTKIKNLATTTIYDDENIEENRIDLSTIPVGNGRCIINEKYFPVKRSEYERVKNAILTRGHEIGINNPHELEFVVVEDHLWDHFDDELLKIGISLSPHPEQPSDAVKFLNNQKK